MYRNPTFDYERDRENTSILVGDVRRVMFIGIGIVAILSIAIMASGGVSAGFTLLLMGGGPLAIIAIVGELVRRWSRRGQ